MGIIKYKVVIAQSGKSDIRAMKRYILENFKYRELAENFLRKMKNTMKKLDVFPEAHKPIGFEYRGYVIYLKSDNLTCPLLKEIILRQFIMIQNLSGYSWEVF